MSKKTPEKPLSLDVKISLTEKVADAYLTYIDFDTGICPVKQSFRITESTDTFAGTQVARIAAIKEIVPPLARIAAKPIASPLQKFAFDTRRVDQERTRIPRANLQNWHRSAEFVEQEDEDRLRIFAKLMKTVNGIKKDFDTQPEWHESYARQLYDNLYRILRIKEADVEIFKPQLSYLEQLIFARYRLSMNELSSMGEKDVRKKIMQKDEKLSKRGYYLQETGLPVATSDSNNSKQIVVDGEAVQGNILNAIFGNNDILKPGDKNSERVITITIRDKVIE